MMHLSSGCFWPLSFGGRKITVTLLVLELNWICCLPGCTRRGDVGVLSLNNQKVSFPISWITFLKAGVNLLISIEQLRLRYLTKYYHFAMTASISAKEDLLAVQPACRGMAYGSSSILSQFIFNIFNSVDNTARAVPKFPLTDAVR
jgi:hypothetical protein